MLNLNFSYVENVDILSRLLLRDTEGLLKITIRAFCFIAPAFGELLPSSLKVAPQTETSSSAAKMFILAFMS